MLQDRHFIVRIVIALAGRLGSDFRRARGGAGSHRTRAKNWEVHSRTRGAIHPAPGEARMPTYEYRCNSCGKMFTQQASISEHETTKPTCPKCNSNDVTQSYSSAVYVKTSKKS
jgi:putative FmdB family regulatory protein